MRTAPPSSANQYTRLLVPPPKHFWLAAESQLQLVDGFLKTLKGQADSTGAYLLLASELVIVAIAVVEIPNTKSHSTMGVALGYSFLQFFSSEYTLDRRASVSGHTH